MTAPAAASTLLALPELFTRLEAALPAPLVKALRHVLARQPETARALWLARPWSRLAPADFRAESDPCAVVIAEPVVTERSLVLDAGQFGGLFGRRDRAIFIFLGAVACKDFCTVPGTWAILDGGLTVERLASFDGGDAQTDVRDHLEAPYVISGLGTGWVELAPKTTAKIGAYARYIKGLARGDKARKHASVAEMFSVPDDQIDSPWAWAADLIRGGGALPAAAAPPRGAKPKKASPKKGRKVATSRAKAPRSRKPPRKRRATSNKK